MEETHRCRGSAHVEMRFAMPLNKGSAEKVNGNDKNPRCNFRLVLKGRAL